jgi:D-alanyl-D-alanine carboxypeptidase
MSSFHSRSAKAEAVPRTNSGRIGVVLLMVVLVACADTNPTSRPSPGFVPATLQPAVTDPAATDFAQDGEAGSPESTEPAGPTSTLEQTATAPSGTEPVNTDVPGNDVDTGDETVPIDDTIDATGTTDIDELGLSTDEPTFEVEPLRPFALEAVEAAPAPPTLDDSGAAVPTGWAAFDRSLEDALLRNGNTAVSVAVAIGGEVVHEDAFGLRAPFISEDEAAPGDRFRIASISKPITAITLLQLVEAGVVGLDDEVGQLVADQLQVTPSAGARRLTARRLLNHTSGFGKYDTQFFGKGADSCEDAARLGIRQGAGSGGYRYSNMNFCVAGVLIEALTGKSYEEAVYEQLLTPLGLSGLRLANTFDPGPGEVLHPSTPDRNYMETLGGAGSWIASPTDLVIILNSLDYSTPGFKPLEPDTVALMETPVGGVAGQRGYGLGLISYGDGRYGHTGTIENTHAMVLNRSDGVIWSITVSGPYPDDTPRLEAIINRAFEAGGFISGQ